jgi:hypothetical protein
MAKDAFSRPHPDDEWFDAVKIIGVNGEPVVSIITLPRFKTSELSGDEWRISGQIRVHTGDPGDPIGLSVCTRVETCCQALYPNLYYHRKELLDLRVRDTRFYRKGRVLYFAHDEGNETTLSVAAACLPWAWITARQDGNIPSDADRFCYQPGCAQDAVSRYDLKEIFSIQGEGPLDAHGLQYYRRFCRRHLRRGDASREDSDHNYVVVSGPGPNEASGYEEFVRPALFGGTIDLSDAEE